MSQTHVADVIEAIAAQMDDVSVATRNPLVPTSTRGRNHAEGT